jgi:amino acid permease
VKGPHGGVDQVGDELVDAHARQVVGTVSVVGTLLTSLGLVADEQVEQSAVARWLVAAAVAAVVVAWACQLLRLASRFTPGNLVDVERWYRRQFRRAYGVWAAGLLLLVAIVVAGAAALVVLATGPTPTV